MTNLRTAAIMKTDLSGSTLRFRALAEADLHAVLLEHRGLVTRHAVAHGGSIVKPEGDGFWLVFPSVTGAALAAMAMQDELRSSQANRGDDRLVMRVVLTVGDVLQEEGALVGDAVVLTTRIEANTPPDEIYLSPSAWLALNRAEVRAAPVATFSLKGFPDPVPVYRVEQTHRTRVITDETIVLTDLRAFTRFVEASPVTTVEKILDALFELANRVARAFGGTIRFGVADAYVLTFADPGRALEAAERLCADWDAFVGREGLGCGMLAAIHHDAFYTFRSFIWGPGLVTVHRVERAASGVVPPDQSAVFVTEEVWRGLAGTAWERRLEPVDLGSALPTRVYRLDRASPGA
jgi:class 3 adenylate cyclase